MAAGLSAAVDRFAEVIERCDKGKWRRSKQRLSTMQSDDVISTAVDFRYWIRGASRGQRPVVAANKVTTNNTVFVELGRYFGKGDMLGRDWFGLQKTLEADANIVEQSLLFPNNWQPATTGVILVNLEVGDIREYDTMVVWEAQFNVMIRQSDVSTLID